MRFAVAVLVSAVAQVLIYLRIAGSIDERSLLTVAYLMLAAIGAGWFAARRSALAGALSVAVGAALYASVAYLGPAGIGMQPLDFVLNVLAVVASFWPYIGLGVVAGAVGGSLHTRLIRAS